MKASEIAKTAGKKLLTLTLKLLAFCLWLFTAILETQLAELNKHLKRYLFPNRP